MKSKKLVGLILVGCMTVLVSAVPLSQEELQDEPYPYKQYIAYAGQIQVRRPRSPQQQNPPPPPPPNRGSVSITGGHTPGAGSFARGDYNHKLWEGSNGARVDANTFYQRNWGSGPRQDYGGGVRLSVPFGG